MSLISPAARNLSAPRILVLSLVFLAVCAPPNLSAEEVVLVQGTQTDTESAGEDAGDLGMVAFTALSMIMSALPIDVQQEIWNSMAEEPEDLPPPLTPNYTIRFTPYAMRMDQGSYTWMIVISDSHVGFFGWDGEERQGVSQVATIQGLVNAAESLSPLQTVLKGYPKRCQPGGEPVEKGPFSARWCDYEHTGAVVAGGMGLGTEVTTVGSAWLATGIPGEETIQAFYRNLDEAVSSSPGVGSYFAGLMAAQIDIIEEGIPIYNKTIITARVGGRELNKNTSVMRVSSVTIEALDDPSEMTEDAVPDDVEMTDLAALAAMTGGGAGAGSTAGTGVSGDVASGSGDPESGGGQVQQGCDCSCEAFQKIQNMSKKERKEWEKSGEGMAMAVCMGQCMSSWMKCAM